MRRIVLSLAILSFVAGCSRFKATNRIDLSPFAETTLSMAAEVEYGLTEAKRSVNLREYWDNPAIASHRKEWDKVRALLKGVVAYSVEVTTLGNSTLSGPDRSVALADYLEPLARPVVESGRFHITPAKLDSILADIRTRETLLEALGGAQPIIDEIARISDNVFDDVHVSLDNTAAALMTAIDENNAKVVEWDKMRKQAQYIIFDSISLLMSYRRGDESALEKLYELDPQLREYASNENKLTLKEINAIEARLFSKMEKVKELDELIAPDVLRYHAQQQELADLYTNSTHQFRKAKLTMIVWSRAHRNLATGITDPAQFNIFDLTKKAIKTVL
jgi:hypothetical protein